MCVYKTQQHTTSAHCENDIRIMDITHRMGQQSALIDVVIHHVRLAMLLHITALYRHIYGETNIRCSLGGDTVAHLCQR